MIVGELNDVYYLRGSHKMKVKKKNKSDIITRTSDKWACKPRIRLLISRQQVQMIQCRKKWGGIKYSFNSPKKYLKIIDLIYENK